MQVSAQNKVEHRINIDIPEVALLALRSSGSTDVNFNSQAPNIAGDKIDIKKASNSSIWLNYSSVIKNNEKRKVTAIVVGDIPKGLRLTLQSSTYSGDGKGKFGIPENQITLSNTPSDVISEIGTCYTGKGPNKGHLLSYQLEIEDNSILYGQISNKNTTLNIVYTLTDDN